MLLSRNTGTKFLLDILGEPPAAEARSKCRMSEMGDVVDVLALCATGSMSASYMGNYGRPAVGLLVV